MNAFAPPEGRLYDRVVTVEMFEHMRNWEKLFSRISAWMKKDGLMFIHVFAHKSSPYAFEVNGESDWMSKYFFSGGMMPSHDMISRLDNSPLKEVERWEVNGSHYGKTCEAWCENLYINRAEVLRLFGECYGGSEYAEMWFQRWRLFFLACAELFFYNEGTEWFVSHHLLQVAQ
jgi:cyclopropane-fatty-acyl-phospholipid synthase